MKNFEIIKSDLQNTPKKWLITGAAGFIGSNLLETLLRLNQTVIGLDNYSTGHNYNLTEVLTDLSDEQAKNFQFIEGDIRDSKDCNKAVNGVDYVLHQAALGSVPRSIKDPISTHENNITGFLNILLAAREAEVKSFIYASSSSTYGDNLTLPKAEKNIGKPWKNP